MIAAVADVLGEDLGTAGEGGGRIGSLVSQVMGRGAERFFEELPDFDRRIGSRQEACAW